MFLIGLTVYLTNDPVLLWSMIWVAVVRGLQYLGERYGPRNRKKWIFNCFYTEPK